MKKTTTFLPLLLFLLACHNNPSETNNLSKNNTPVGDTINLTDTNNLKQGKWIVFENGKKVKEEWYKDGKLIDK